MCIIIRITLKVSISTPGGIKFCAARGYRAVSCHTLYNLVTTLYNFVIRLLHSDKVVTTLLSPYLL